MITATGAESLMTSIDWWDSAFKIGIIIAIGFGALVGRGIGGKIWSSFLAVFIWFLVYWPLFFLGTIFGTAAESYVDTRVESVAMATVSGEQF